MVISQRGIFRFMGLLNKYIKLKLPGKEAAPLIKKLGSSYQSPPKKGGSDNFEKHLANTGVLFNMLLTKNTKGVLFK